MFFFKCKPPKHIMVADVAGDGFLGMDYLRVADAWIGAKNGQIHMNVKWHMVTCQLRAERQPVRRVAHPVKTVVVQPLTRSAVCCTEEPPFDEPGRESLRAVADMVWYPPSDMRVPEALIPTENEVVIPFVNYGSQAVVVGEARPIALVDEVAELSSEVGEALPQVVRSVSQRQAPSDSDPQHSAAVTTDATVGPSTKLA